MPDGSTFNRQIDFASVRKQTITSHAVRVPDEDMAPRYERDEWLGIIRETNPIKGSDWVFVSSGAVVTIGQVVGWSAETWHVGQWRGGTVLIVRRLSRRRWHPFGWVRWRCCMDNEYYDAVALGDAERATAIQLAIGGKGPWPRPLSPRRRRQIPRIMVLRGYGQ